ncbi:hypothetical protein OCH7691_00962 [Oceanibacterium hippocampi]|uniref:Lipid A deacylase LpxR family protein n=2 Tax=Oceanibacterium hippocampi TaxID=745714 RepID=A0A1Y5RYT7_9PROT|nr:hypothetical protein OCH7691_00962 [Oceanibacterium hippocampi]
MPCTTRAVATALLFLTLTGLTALGSPRATAGEAAGPPAPGPAETAAGAPLPADSAPEGERGTFSFVLENDLFYGRDRDYTNGIQVGWTSNPQHVPYWVVKAANLFPLFPGDGRVRASFSLGQSMYTPADISLADPPAEDRPYAGWLYGSVGLISENGSQLDQLRLQVGVVGSPSLAEQAQKIVHEVIGSPEPKGWDKQLRAEPGIQLTYQRSLRAFVSGELFGFAFDVTPHLGGALGNVFTYGNAGATFRVGYNLPDDYGPPRVQPSLPGSGYFIARDRPGGYFFAGFDGRAVAHNIFLDGNTFTDSRSVDRIPLVADLQLGVAFTWRSTRLAYTYVLRSHEFEGQDSADEFGAISLSFQF